MLEKLNINAVIIDDSAQARKLLRLMLMEFSPEITVIGEAENAEDGLRLVKKTQPDAVFLDIEMPGQSGLQMAESLLEFKFKGNVVFTTAYNSYALKAFRLSAIDYLLKPIQEDHLLEAVFKLGNEKKNRDTLLRLEALSTNLSESKENVLCIPIQGGYQFIQLQEIEYLEADGSYVQIKCSDKKTVTVSKNLKYFETVLSENKNFVRAHRSYIVNMESVITFSKSDGGSLHLKGGKQIPVSRERKSDVQNYFS
jgi:two-component system LytT family response regulator